MERWRERERERERDNEVRGEGVRGKERGERERDHMAVDEQRIMMETTSVGGNTGMMSKMCM